MRAEQDSGTVRVQWGTGDDEQCLIDYQLPERNTSTGYDVLELACTAGGATPVLKAAAGDALTMR
jgi:outer membrane usher protein